MREYSATTANYTNTINATPTDERALVQIEVDGAGIANGTPAAWSGGDNTVTITVHAGALSQVYTVTVAKE